MRKLKKKKTIRMSKLDKKKIRDEIKLHNTEIKGKREREKNDVFR